MAPLSYYEGFRLVTPAGDDPLRSIARSMREVEVRRETPRPFDESRALARSIREAPTVKVMVIKNLETLLDDRREKLRSAARLLKAA